MRSQVLDNLHLTGRCAAIAISLCACEPHLDVAEMDRSSSSGPAPRWEAVEELGTVDPVWVYETGYSEVIFDFERGPDGLLWAVGTDLDTDRAKAWALDPATGDLVFESTDDAASSYRALAVDHQRGAIYAAGSSLAHTEAVVRLGPDGMPLWRDEPRSDTSFFGALAVVPSGRVLAGGGSSTMIDNDHGAPGGLQISDVHAYEPDGTHAWSYHEELSHVRAIVPDGTGGTVLAFNGMEEVEPGSYRAREFNRRLAADGTLIDTIPDTVSYADWTSFTLAGDRLLYTDIREDETLQIDVLDPDLVRLDRVGYKLSKWGPLRGHQATSTRDGRLLVSSLELHAPGDKSAIELVLTWVSTDFETAEVVRVPWTFPHLDSGPARAFALAEADNGDALVAIVDGSGFIPTPGQTQRTYVMRVARPSGR